MQGLTGREAEERARQGLDNVQVNKERLKNNAGINRQRS